MIIERLERALSIKPSHFNEEQPLDTVNIDIDDPEAQSDPVRATIDSQALNERKKSFLERITASGKLPAIALSFLLHIGFVSFADLHSSDNLSGITSSIVEKIKYAERQWRAENLKKEQEKFIQEALEIKKAGKRIPDLESFLLQSEYLFHGFSSDEEKTAQEHIDATISQAKAMKKAKESPWKVAEYTSSQVTFKSKQNSLIEAMQEDDPKKRKANCNVFVANGAGVLAKVYPEDYAQGHIKIQVFGPDPKKSEDPYGHLRNVFEFDQNIQLVMDNESVFLEPIPDPAYAPTTVDVSDYYLDGFLAKHGLLRLDQEDSIGTSKSENTAPLKYDSLFIAPKAKTVYSGEQAGDDADHPFYSQIKQGDKSSDDSKKTTPYNFGWDRSDPQDQQRAQEIQKKLDETVEKGKHVFGISEALTYGHFLEHPEMHAGEPKIAELANGVLTLDFNQDENKKTAITKEGVIYFFESELDFLKEKTGQEVKAVHILSSELVLDLKARVALARQAKARRIEVTFNNELVQPVVMRDQNEYSGKSFQEALDLYNNIRPEDINGFNMNYLFNTSYIADNLRYLDADIAGAYAKTWNQLKIQRFESPEAVDAAALAVTSNNRLLYITVSEISPEVAERLSQYPIEDLTLGDPRFVSSAIDIAAAEKLSGLQTRSLEVNYTLSEDVAKVLAHIPYDRFRYSPSFNSEDKITEIFDQQYYQSIVAAAENLKPNGYLVLGEISKKAYDYLSGQKDLDFWFDKAYEESGEEFVPILNIADIENSDFRLNHFSRYKNINPEVLKRALIRDYEPQYTEFYQAIAEGHGFVERSKDHRYIYSYPINPEQARVISEYATQITINDHLALDTLQILADSRSLKKIFCSADSCDKNAVNILSRSSTIEFLQANYLPNRVLEWMESGSLKEVQFNYSKDINNNAADFSILKRLLATGKVSVEYYEGGQEYPDRFEKIKAIIKK